MHIFGNCTYPSFYTVWCIQCDYVENFRYKVYYVLKCFTFQLCHPRGLSFRTQKYGGPRDAQFHTFIITRADGSQVYGASLVFDEKIDDEEICLAMQTLQARNIIVFLVIFYELLMLLSFLGSTP